MNLFLDLNGISKDEEWLLDKFAVVRNRFAHQLDVKTLFDCIALDPDKAVRKFFEKKYAGRIINYEFVEDNSMKSCLCSWTILKKPVPMFLSGCLIRLVMKLKR